MKEQRFQQLIEEGLSIEKALEVIVKEFTKINNKVTYIGNLNDISEVRLMIKRAYAKKSKSEKPETIARYQKEIDTGNRRLNELLAQADDDLGRLIELGEQPSKLLHRWVRTREAELRDEINKLKGTRNEKKELLNAQPIDTPESIIIELKAIHPDLVDEYQDRVRRNDQGTIALNRKVRVLETVS